MTLEVYMKFTTADTGRWKMTQELGREEMYGARV